MPNLTRAAWSAQPPPPERYERLLELLYGEKDPAGASDLTETQGEATTGPLRPAHARGERSGVRS
jgi:hypothetical protein